MNFRPRYLALIAAFALVLPSERIEAQDDRGTGVNVVQKFEQFCLAGTSGSTAISSIVEQEKSWSSISFPSDYMSDKAGTKLAWSGQIDGRDFELIFINFPLRKQYGTHCVLRSAAKERFYPYFDDFRTVTKKFGLDGKQVDVPHYFRASGKLGSGKRADAILATRSPIASSTNYTSLQLFY